MFIKTVTNCNITCLLKSLFLAFCVVASSLSSLADENLPKHMTQMEYVPKDSSFPTTLFPSKPVKLWRAGEYYLAALEAPDYENGIHGLFVVSQPDSWKVNLFTRSAKHILDPGPSLLVHMPIFRVEEGSALKELEFGKELEFFIKLNAKKHVTDNLISYTLDIGSDSISLVVNSVTNTPKLVEKRSNTNTVTIEYLSYDNSVTFDPSVFKLPDGISTEEAAELDSDHQRLPNPKNLWVSDFLTFYYQAPNPLRISESLQAIGEEVPADSLASLVGFYGPIMEANPSLVSSWIEVGKGLRSRMQRLLFLSLRQCGTEACMQVLNQNPYAFAPEGIQTFAATKPQTFENLALTSGTNLDLLWAHFFATGSEAPVLRIIKLVSENWGRRKLQRLSTGEAVIVAAAHWALVSNAKQHPVIRDILARESKESRTLKRVLDEVDA
jgi:hypothetical protein